MRILAGKVAVVTGGSRGVGKGIATALADHGAHVYVTGRSEQDLQHINGHGTAVCCDHRVDAQVEAAFRHILDESPGIDILVNNVWGGYERMVDGG